MKIQGLLKHRRGFMSPVSVPAAPAKPHMLGLPDTGHVTCNLADATADLMGASDLIASKPEDLNTRVSEQDKEQTPWYRRRRAA